ncbi:Protein of unknown function [Pyronema omphalodes CBS 100304]|uniref:Uncharacterized protein n=1 Tax=Pyronema omphalodes (strain CBS 100304) TaxID=1076935 RepID=U4LPW4_PYROM|nr:Protein of unknown function [Pyronema omphalodes CBS 100304]
MGESREHETQPHSYPKHPQLDET